MTHEQIATLLNQLGGKKFSYMVGMKQLIQLENGISFKITRNKTRTNTVTITLEPDDTYSMKFEYVSFNRKTFDVKRKLIAEYSMVYVDMLQDIFENVTGLATRL